MKGFGGFGGGNNMQALMRQAQKMQEDALRAQKEVEESGVEGSVSGGMVTVKLSGAKNLLEVNDNIRCFKHDFNNIIQAIDGYIYLDDMKSLQVYFNSLLGECNHIKVVDSINCQVIDNPAICGVLLNKYRIAEENKIQMNIEFMGSFKELNEKSYVVSRMLGILLDNAIEAANECEEKIINFEVVKDIKLNKLVIKIENSYNDKDIDTSKIFEKNYTSKGEKGNTGLGLWKIHDILRKDTSLELYTTKDDDLFKQRLEIYLNNK